MDIRLPELSIVPEKVKVLSGITSPKYENRGFKSIPETMVPNIGAITVPKFKSVVGLKLIE